MKRLILITMAVMLMAVFSHGADMKTGDVYHGFRLMKQEYVDEVKSTALLFEHVKTGAKLLKLENSDKENVFNIIFRTIPETDNAVAHIMEHSVLCGSRKYTSKSPFSILTKGSMNTFLNAMTSNDRTQYPIASNNEKDFFNLMDVYLDAVFFPALLENEMILKQEGWRYEYDREKDELKYNGIVFNEMKGAMSSPMSVVYRKAAAVVLPDTVFAVNSGGDPAVIPDLTYEEFKAFHKKYYHPSNSYIFLYGDIDTAKQLEVIDRGFLSQFDRQLVDIPSQRQEYYGGFKQETITYPGIDNGANDMLILTYVLDGMETGAESYALDIIDEVIMGNDASPLKKALEDGDIGASSYSYMDGGPQQMYTIAVRGSSSEKADRFLKIIESEFRKYAAEGLEEQLIEAAVNKKLFRLKDEGAIRFSKGLRVCFSVMNDWIYSSDPFTGMKYQDFIDTVRDEKDLYKKVIKKYILENNFKALVIAEPEKEMNRMREEDIKDRLEKEKAAMDESQFSDIVRMNMELKKYHNTPDSPEDIASVPMIKVDDIEKDISLLPAAKERYKNGTIYRYPADTNGIIYTDVYLDMSSIGPDEVGYAVLVSKLMGRVPAGGLTVKELTNQLDIYTGGFDADVTTVSNVYENNEWKPYLHIFSKSLSEYSADMYKLMDKILRKSEIASEERVGQLIKEELLSIEQRLNSSPFEFARMSAMSSIDENGVFNDLAFGLGYLDFIRKVNEDFNKDPEAVIKSLDTVFKKMINGNEYQASLITEDKLMKKNIRRLKKLIAALPVGEGTREKEHFEIHEGYGISTQSRVNYVFLSTDSGEYQYSGAMRVASRILSREYLWQGIRVKGGAYGAGIRANRNGIIYLYSYRDPGLENTLDVYRGVADYLREFDPSKREMDRFVIGTMSQVDRPLSSYHQGRAAVMRAMTGLSEDDVKKERQEILSVTPEEIRGLADIFSDRLEKWTITELGGRDAVNYDGYFGRALLLIKMETFSIKS